MKRVAIYSRKSKETDTGESIKNQIQFCKDYFLRKEKDYKFEVFQDEGFSGGNTNRPEFQRMMLQAQQNKFDIIACYKVDRISRNIIEFMNIFDILQKNDVSLVSITEGFDPNTPVGMMMMTLLAGFAEMERLNIAQRVKDNMQALAKLGRWSGGTPPTGYKSVRLQNGDKTAMYLEFIQEYEDKIVKLFSLAAAGNTLYNISSLTQMPVKTITNIINNPVYCKSDLTSKKYLESIGYEVFGELNEKGYLPYNRRPKNKKGKKLFNAKGMFATVSMHYAPINSELWIKANMEVKQRGEEKRPRISQYSFLAHMVKCGCGSGMYINPGHKKKDGTRKYYFCCSAKKNGSNCTNKRIVTNYLENDILDSFKDFTLNKDKLKAYINKKPVIDVESEINKIKKEIKKLDINLDNLTNQLSRLSGTAADKVIESMNNLSKKIDEYNNQIFELERKNISSKIDKINIDILQDNIKKILISWDNLTMEDKQKYIRNIIKEIKWDGGENFNIIFKI